MQQGRQRTSMTIPGTGGQYAAQELVCTLEGTVASLSASLPVHDLSVLVETLPAAATIEVWLLRVGGTPATAGHWVYSGTDFDAVGLGVLFATGAWSGVKLRGKSGGTAGTADVSATWD